MIIGSGLGFRRAGHFYRFTGRPLRAHFYHFMPPFDPPFYHFYRFTPATRAIYREPSRARPRPWLRAAKMVVGMKDLMTMKVTELKEELEARDEPVSGNKA